MAKLTRTQKYADLRNELANDKEATNASQGLSGYVDRFNNVQDTLAPEATKMPSTEPEYTYKQQNDNQSSYFDSFMNAPVQEKQDDFSSFFKEEKTNDLGFEDYKEVFKDVNDATDDVISKLERDTYLNQTISDVNFHNIAMGETTLNQIVDNAVNEVRHTEEIKPVYNEPEIEDNTYSFNPSLAQEELLDADEIINDDDFSNTVSMEITKIMDEMNKTTEVKQVVNEPVYAEPTPLTIETPVVNEPVSQPIPTVQEVRTQTPVMNEFIQESTPVVQEVKNEAPVMNEFIQEPTPVMQQTIVETPVVNEFIQELTPAVQQTVVETPVVNTVIEEKPEEVVEIKNIKEMASEPLRNTISGTIPFVVAADNEEDIEDEDDSEGSNVVLNIILIVLIVVLMAVLGLIIFYILKTKGIL